LAYVDLPTENGRGLLERAQGGRVDGLRDELYGSSEMYKTKDEHGAGHVNVGEARDAFAELVNRAAYGHERVVVARRGRPIAAIVPIEDLEFMERMEDELDLEAAREALADPENAVSIPWEQVKAELGL
jgi:prevent-host-death family protein